MNATADELAGVVELFGELTREELRQALTEVAYRADGQSLSESAFEAALDDALETFSMVAYERDGRTLYAAGPTAFPTTPAHAEDLPHILDVEPRRPHRERLGGQVADRFAADVADAIDASDAERARRLVDVSYDVEAWAPVELDDERDRLDDLLEER